MQVRSGSTGALLAQGPPLAGVTAPEVSQVIGGGYWISEATGMQGYVARVPLAAVSAATCAPTLPTSTCLSGSNDLHAVVADGVLWVSQTYGGPQRNFCADPETGAVRAALPLLADEPLLAVGSCVLFVEAPPTTAGDLMGSVREVPIPPACFGR